MWCNRMNGIGMNGRFRKPSSSSSTHFLCLLMDYFNWLVKLVFRDIGVCFFLHTLGYTKGGAKQRQKATHNITWNKIKTLIQNNHTNIKGSHTLPYSTIQSGKRAELGFRVGLGWLNKLYRNQSNLLFT